MDINYSNCECLRNRDAVVVGADINVRISRPVGCHFLLPSSAESRFVAKFLDTIIDLPGVLLLLCDLFMLQTLEHRPMERI